MIELLTLWVILSVGFHISRSVADRDKRDYGMAEKGRIKTNLNAIALTLNIYDYLKTVDYYKLLTPKTPIQKEIEEKRKEIEQLKKQKADMAELEKLKRQEEELFREIKEDK